MKILYLTALALVFGGYPAVSHAQSDTTAPEASQEQNAQTSTSDNSGEQEDSGVTTEVQVLDGTDSEDYIAPPEWDEQAERDNAYDDPSVEANSGDPTERIQNIENRSETGAPASANTKVDMR